MARCSKCGYVFRVLEGEEMDHPCPKCKFHPEDYEGVACCKCEAQVVGYIYGDPYCAQCYVNRPAFWEKRT